MNDGKTAVSECGKIPLFSLENGVEIFAEEFEENYGQDIDLEQDENTYIELFSRRTKSSRGKRWHWRYRWAIRDENGRLIPTATGNSFKRGSKYGSKVKNKWIANQIKRRFRAKRRERA